METAKEIGMLSCATNDWAKSPITALKAIGLQLDRDIFPRVKNGGNVMPSENTNPTITWAKESTNERKGQEGSKSIAWTGPERGQRATVRPGAPSTATSIIGTCLQTQYEEELDAITKAYPGTRVWREADGLWVMHESFLLTGVWPKAVFLTGIPFDHTRIVRSWGFWVGPPLERPTWIGPRHTNFPDGSICAFEPNDGSWCLGNSLLVLLDLYTVWALRHLHLQVFKRWPGRQVAHFAYERRTELQASEFCGCGSNLTYEDCCREDDLNGDLVVQAMEYFDQGGGRRNPPDEVMQFIYRQERPPRIKDLFVNPG